jgi:hypothetical protein
MTDGRHRQQRRTDVKLKLITAAVLATVVATTLIAAPASAGPLGNAFQRQKAAIGNGLANNSLTLNEAGRLIKQTKTHQEGVPVPECGRPELARAHVSRRPPGG